MKGSRFSEEQKVRILEELRGGRSRKEICAKHNTISQTISLWKRKYGEMDVNEARKLKGVRPTQSLIHVLSGEYRHFTINITGPFEWAAWYDEKA